MPLSAKTRSPSTPTARFAVTDGATEAFHAQQWATNLAEHWVRKEATLTLEEFRKWVATEGRELHDSWNGLTLSWYSEEKARTGSFAAFVGVELDLKTARLHGKRSRSAIRACCIVAAVRF